MDSEVSAKRRGSAADGDGREEAASRLQAAIRACPQSKVFVTGFGGGGSDSLTLVMRMSWPRKLSSPFRIERASAVRLQGALQRLSPNRGHVRVLASVMVLERTMLRAMIQRKYRAASFRKHTRGDVPRAMTRPLFVQEGDMDQWDLATITKWKEMYLSAEQMYVDLRESFKVEAVKKAQLKELTLYEDRLYNDVTRGGGGGLVRELGGQKNAKKKLVDIQGQLETLNVESKSAQDKVERLSRDIKWMWSGGWDSLAAQELLVQDAHMYCNKGEYVCLATRYVSDYRMASAHGLVGKLKAKHSVGTWWVDFSVAEKKLPFSVGGGGVYHLRYATETEKHKAEQQEEELANVRKMAEKAKNEANAKSAANSSMAPINLFYNRNPILCIPYIPITQATNALDERYLVSGINYAAAIDDPRLKPPTQTLMSRVIPTCTGLPPFKFSWQAVWPCTKIPSGLLLDQASGEVSGACVAEFEDVSIAITCHTADGGVARTQLRFSCRYRHQHPDLGQSGRENMARNA